MERTMSDLGFLYVLANSAMPGLVKVGKTTRSPTDRAGELSGVTGIPTPFIVVYEQCFQDCSAAESFVHTHLANNGYRISDRREFFNAPANVVIRAIGLAPGAIDSGSEQSGAEIPDELLIPQELDELDDLALTTSLSARPWVSIYAEAEAHYYGYDDYLQDYAEALRVYRQAATLGSISAYGRIGRMYERGEGVAANNSKALLFYKEGARKNSVYCYWRMGVLFNKEENHVNADKCFTLFLENMPDIEPNGQLIFPHMPEVHGNGQHLSADELRDLIIDCVWVALFKRYFDDPNLHTPLNGFFDKWRMEISNWTKETLDLQMKSPNGSALIQEHLHKVVQRCDVLSEP